MEELVKEINEKLNKMEERDQRVEEGNGRIERKLDNIQIELIALKKENEERKRENEKLEGEIRKQNEKIILLEKELRKRNLIIFGIEEMENEDYQIQQAKVQEVFDKTGAQAATANDIIDIRRLGKKTGNSTRPMMVELSSGNKKMEILRLSKNLKNTGWSINEDFPKEIQAQRKELLEQMKKARNEGHKATVKYNKLIVDGKDYSVESAKDWANPTHNEQEKTEENEGGRGITRKASQRTPSKEDELRGELAKITKTAKRTTKN